MPKNIVLAIKSKYAQMIYNGEKAYEYRKKFPIDVERVYLYETSPVQRITGYFEVGLILKGFAEALFDFTNFQGLSRAELTRYLKGKEGKAILTKKFHKYDNPVDPYLVYDPWYPPQNFRYITHEQELKLWDLE